MNRDTALGLVEYCVDDCYAERSTTELGDHPKARLVGFNSDDPIFIGVWSSLGDGYIDDREAAGYAADLLREKEWFGPGSDASPFLII